MSLNKNTRGFTIIELMVVLSIIAILSSIILTSLQRSQEKSRDARRVSDIKEIQLALSLYYNDNSCYPPNIYNNSTCGTATSGLSPNYMSVVPKDPQTVTAYSYAPLTGSSNGSSCTSYHLGSVLENASDVSGSDKVTLNASSNSNSADSRGLYVCNVVGASSDFDGTLATVFDVTP
jgi:prepilin-type N-terminal cleavage/methylation domain-containing protein